jgi:carbonic anhydrase/acetyltransferase-like protein (isoleucine patch superfamily)
MTSNILSFRGNTPRISETAFIAQTAVVIGDVEIGDGSGIWYGCTVRADMNEIRIGNNVNIQDGTVVHVDSRTYGTYIHDNVTIGHMALIHACVLEEGSMVGMRATVMDGAVVEKGALVAAGALVAPGKRVGAGEVWAGTPARKLRDIGERDQDMLDYIWPSYRDLGAEYIAAGYGSRKRSGE